MNHLEILQECIRFKSTCCLPGQSTRIRILAASLGILITLKKRHAATDFQASRTGKFAAILVVACAVALAVLKDRVVGIIAVSPTFKSEASSVVFRARRRALLTNCHTVYDLEAGDDVNCKSLTVESHLVPPFARKGYYLFIGA